MAHLIRFGAFAGAIAAATIAVTPAQAAPHSATGTVGYATSVHTQLAGLPNGGFDTSIYNGEAQETEWRRGRRGWRRGWRRRGIRGGDILAGVLVIGGIAAIASAANNNRRRDREVVVVERDRYDDRRYDDRRYDDRRLDDRRSNPRSSSGSGIDNAVSMCLSEIERDVRVDSVDGASRTPQGWLVSGTLFNGSSFTCQIGNDGRISGVDYGSFSGVSFDPAPGATPIDGEQADAPAQGQWTDASYADARAAMRGQSTSRFQGEAQPLVPLTSDRLPAYPGGPLPGEEFSE